MQLISQVSRHRVPTIYSSWRKGFPAVGASSSQRSGLLTCCRSWSRWLVPVDLFLKTTEVCIGKVAAAGCGSREVSTLTVPIGMDFCHDNGSCWPCFGESEDGVTCCIITAEDCCTIIEMPATQILCLRSRCPVQDEQKPLLCLLS